MCGIAGALNLDGSPLTDHALVWRMTRALAHRGPDDEGVHLEGPAGLGHRRLAILDLSPGGHQPMRDSASGRVLVYNGEIYNFRELREAAQPQAGEFFTNCDTEVLLKIAEFDDTRWLHGLNGMFAFGLWDPTRRELLLGRDRLGIKPLYWTVAGGRFLFASEIKALLAVPEVSRRIRPEALPEYLAYRSLAGDETLLAGIRQCRPGHVLRIRPGEALPRAACWWDDLSAGPWRDGLSGPVEEQFATLFGSAVAYRLISDVPVGTYNSGGVDSSLVTAEVRRRTAGPLHTFSVGFEEASHDESRYARIVADRLGTEHHRLVMNARDYAAALEETIWFCEEPLNHAHTVPLLRLSRYAREHVTVVLTGEGADELFAGYPRYQIPLLARWLRHLPRLLTDPCVWALRRAEQRRLLKLLEAGRTVRRGVVDNARWLGDAQIDALGAGRPRLSDRLDLYARVEASSLDPLEQVLAFDRGTYLPSLLHRLDRTTMASGVEARVPFLDYRLLGWSKTLPRAAKLALGRENKVLLKRIAAASFPREMIYRRKMGFDVPIGTWLRDARNLGRYLDLLLDRTFAERGLFRPREAERLVREHRQGTADHAEILWPMINLELWQRRFLDAPPAIRTPEPGPQVVHAIPGGRS